MTLARWGVIMTSGSDDNVLSVAETKARFSELITRVQNGERFVVERRGRPVLALVHPDFVGQARTRPKGLASIAGALEDWTDLPEAVQEIYAARRRAHDRPGPDLE
jgi:antitoxin (DNA-binding transcriptional repressor) of toxin-antitoxin stability system